MYVYVCPDAWACVCMWVYVGVYVYVYVYLCMRGCLIINLEAAAAALVVFPIFWAGRAYT